MTSEGRGETMCGRFTLTQPGQLRLRFGLEKDVTLDPRYNVAPAQDIPVVRSQATGRVSWLPYSSARRNIVLRRADEYGS